MILEQNNWDIYIEREHEINGRKKTGKHNDTYPSRETERKTDMQTIRSTGEQTTGRT